MINLVCFDLDGVLVDACEAHKDALNRALVLCSRDPISDEDHYGKFNGLPTLKKLEKMGIPKEEALRISWYKQEYTKEWMGSLDFDDSKYALLSWLKARNIKIACVSNSIKDTMVLALSSIGVLGLVDLIISNQSISNPKPSSEGYIEAMVSLGYSPKNTLIIEDSPHGLTSARNTGAKVMEVKNATEVTVKNVRNYL